MIIPILQMRNQDQEMEASDPLSGGLQAEHSLGNKEPAFHKLVRNHKN